MNVKYDTRNLKQYAEVLVGKSYVHYRSRHEYLVLHVGMDARNTQEFEDDRIVVVYCASDTKDVFTRPISEFLEVINHPDLGIIQRFTRCIVTVESTPQQHEFTTEPNQTKRLIFVRTLQDAQLIANGKVNYGRVGVRVQSEAQPQSLYVQELIDGDLDTIVMFPNDTVGWQVTTDTPITVSFYGDWTGCEEDVEQGRNRIRTPSNPQDTDLSEDEEAVIDLSVRLSETETLSLLNAYAQRLGNPTYSKYLEDVNSSISSLGMRSAVERALLNAIINNQCIEALTSYSRDDATL